MTLRSLTYLLLSITLLNCNDENIQTTSAIGAPAWQDGYPAVAFGAVSADLNVSNNGDTKVYYLVSTKPLNVSAEQVKKLAVSPNVAEIKYNGVIDAPQGIESRKTIAGLGQNTKYFTYFIAQNKKDTLYQNIVKHIAFTTYYRQDTSEYQSTAENRKVKYLIYRPEAALKYADKKYPICYFLGGNGEVGSAATPINMIRNGSLPEYIYKGNNVDMIVMSIQHTANNWNTTLIDEGITHGNSKYPVDPARVYLTGISGGAFGCWNYAVTHPDKLTAIVPISGGGNTGKACTLKNLPVWGFHNQIDNIVGAAGTTTMISSIKACPSNKEVKELLFPDTGHDCWRRVYDKNHPNWSKSPGVAKVDVFAWMLSKSK